MSLTPDEQTTLKRLITRAKRLSGTYFRSVERRFMDPSKVLLVAGGVQGLLFKSAVGRSTNLLVFLKNCVPGQIEIRKFDETIDTLKQIIATYKP